MQERGDLAGLSSEGGGKVSGTKPWVCSSGALLEACLSTLLTRNVSQLIAKSPPHFVCSDEVSVQRSLVNRSFSLTYIHGVELLFDGILNNTSSLRL